MTDHKGNPIQVGQRVRFRVENAFDPILGTVRAVGRDRARCDDGKPEDPDMYTNGFRWSAWVDSHDLEVVS